ncbi:FecCD family ABC transporter permease [Cytobacillus purgationiresistens]|uniref:Iron complex transport system permease protein n=1 Tax=Cytobacillus purgationiresistens TaxID=863449 RepID=A0ABU0AIN9_9BACI|nr:iron ABC transporter permease [Cytobacillus purgationiresistens]MDQ0270637.1 iron complex transport system permease protein [Cytobacillus purgationiresistens]
MLLKTTKQKWLGMIAGILLTVAAICMSIVYGYTNTTWSMAMDSFIHFNGSNEHIVLQTVRLPRALIAATVGASLAIAGVIMQTLTKNPLASPDILGINAGAGFAIVLFVTFFGMSDLQHFTVVSIAGAAISALCVYVISMNGRDGLTPMKITLAGAAMAALFSSLTQGILVTNEAAFEQVLFWLAGSVAGRKMEILTSVLPYIIIGIVLSMMFSSKMNVLATGEDVAKGLGLKTGRLKLIMGLTVILLAGGAVAIAGPIGFIGMVIPHIARYCIGNDHRWLIPFSGLLGSIVLIAADILSRYILMPREIPVGVMTAIIGTPLFIYIARKGFGGNEKI